MESREENRTSRVSDSARSEAVKGYRLWRLVDGQMRSQTNDTVWPVDHALSARAYLRPSYLGLSFPFIAVMLGYWAVATTATTALLKFASKSEFLAPMLESLGLTSDHMPVVIGVLMFVNSVFGWFSAAPWIYLSVMAKLRGQVVVPGNSTPGIYAMWDLSDVRDDDAESKPGQLIVRGSVWLWGDLIEHQRGVKGEFAYPDLIRGIHCVACPGWMPIGDYVDESTPPVHEDCLAVGFKAPEGWRPAGLANLREAAPRWFMKSRDAQHTTL